jgi:hypothetical protein
MGAVIMMNTRRVLSSFVMAAAAVMAARVPAGAQTRRAATTPRPSTRSADGYVNARRLGGSTAFHKPPLTDLDSLRRMARTRSIQADIRKVLNDSGVGRTADEVVAALSNGAAAPGAGLCADMKPTDGALAQCDFAIGSTMEWMAYRPNAARGDRTPGRLEKVRWAGPAVFKAFLFRITSDDKVYTFVVPKTCGNLALMSVSNVERAATAPVPTPPPTPPPAPRPAPTPPPAPPAPAPAQAPPAAQVVPPPAPAGYGPFFVDAYAGKDRRVRPTGDRTSGNGNPVIANAGAGEFAQCSPLVGVAIGVRKRYQNDWELTGSAGIGFSLVTDDLKVHENEVFIDVEGHKYLGRAFVGTGISLWDVTHSDTFTPAWLFLFGVPLGDQPNPRTYFVGEARWLLDHADDISNNYQFWAGVRVKF